MNFEDHVTIVPGVRSGRPCIKGTRITVYDVLEYLADGMTEAELLVRISAHRDRPFRHRDRSFRSS